MRYLFLLLITAICLSCNNSKRYDETNSPLATVIKLKSAETSGRFDEAKKYQDINSIYGQLARNESKTPEKFWREIVSFGLNLAKNKKFTNDPKYFNYDIREVIYSDTAKVILNDLNKKSPLNFTYKLELRQGKWIVTHIIFDRKW